MPTTAERSPSRRRSNMQKGMVAVVGSLFFSGTEDSGGQPIRTSALSHGMSASSGIVSASSDISRNRSSSGCLETTKGSRIYRSGSEGEAKVTRRNFRPNPPFFLLFSSLCFSPVGDYSETRPNRFPSNILFVSRGSPRPTYHRALTSLRMIPTIAFFFTPPSRATLLSYQALTTRSF